MGDNKNNATEEAASGETFLKIAQENTEKLLNLAKRADDIQENQGISDDERGNLRAVAGQARLLVKKKISQFEGLCDRNLHPKAGEPPVKVEDLAGFWDLILIEIRSLTSNFENVAAKID